LAVASGCPRSAGESEGAPPEDSPALPPPSADPDAAGAAAAPGSAEEYPPPGAAAPPPAWAERFWLWTLRAARWAALPPQAAEVSNPAVRRTKRRRDAMQLTSLAPQRR